MVNFDLHSFVSWFFLRTTRRKPITRNPHQKQHVVWTAPFWIIVGTFTASHGKMNWSPPISSNKKCEQIPSAIVLNDLWHVENYGFHSFVSWSFSKEKNPHQKPTSKTKCCLNSTLLSHSGHFCSIPWEIVNKSPPIFLNVIWHVVNFDLHIFVSWFILRITNRKIITRYLWKMLTFIFCVFWCLLRFKKYHHQNQNGKRWQGLKSAPSTDPVISWNPTTGRHDPLFLLSSVEYYP